MASKVLKANAAKARKSAWSPAARKKRKATMDAKKANGNTLPGNEEPLIDLVTKATRKYTKKAPPGDARTALIEAAINLLRMAQNQS